MARRYDEAFLLAAETYPARPQCVRSPVEVVGPKRYSYDGGQRQRRPLVMRPDPGLGGGHPREVPLEPERHCLRRHVRNLLDCVRTA